MKLKRHLLTAVLLTGLVAGTLSVRADEISKAAQTEQKDAKAKPYPLKKCIVSGEKLGEMGKPVTLTYKGQEMKFCCKDCVKDFKKDPEKFIKKLADEEKKTKKEPFTSRFGPSVSQIKSRLA